MNWKLNIRSTALGIFLGVLVVIAVGAANHQNRAWEYSVIDFRSGVVQDQETLDRMGTDGWELVTSYGYDDNRTVKLMFKRQR